MPLTQCELCPAFHEERLEVLEWRQRMYDSVRVRLAREWEVCGLLACHK